MLKIIIILILLGNSLIGNEYLLPVDSDNRRNVNYLELTEIGEFGAFRKDRPGIPAHFHTGIDIKRPANNYNNEPVYSIFNGTVISKREDGPYAQLIIEHESKIKFWTVYEHIAGIKVELFEQVTPNKPIARYMNQNELNEYGWQFDHFHFEILKVPPTRLKNNRNPERLFASFTLVCFTIEELNEYFYDPIIFLRDHIE